MPLLFLFFLLLLTAPLTIYSLKYSGKIYPNIKIAGVDVGGKTPEEASNILSSKISPPGKVNLVAPTETVPLITNDIGLSYDFASSAHRAYLFTRTGNFLADLQQKISLLTTARNFGLSTAFDENSFSKVIAGISDKISQEPVFPSIKIENGTVTVDRGKAGVEVDTESLRAEIGAELAFAQDSDINIPLQKIDPSLTDDEVATAKDRGEKYIGKTLQLKFEFNTDELSDSELAKFIDPKGQFRIDEINKEADKIAGEIERDPQNPKFQFTSGKVSEFQPALDGIKLDREKFSQSITIYLHQIANPDQKNLAFDIPVIKTPPDIATGEINNMGIKELIGRGSSTYYHSIASRVHNIVLAASKINGTLVKPGDTFSFNDTLGDVSKFTGYQEAYIISEGKTVLGDGGGVCQVSTTLFRAALDAGLPIVDRTAHAYRVGYYEQDSPPGLDATVYSPAPDFKFKNDTPASILIEAQADPRNLTLVFELYGTSDGRTSAISKPITSNVTPPPDDLFQDDPTLPAGTIKQIDFKAWGARVTFNYTVARGGEQIYQKTFVSNYQPWQAVYLRGTGPAQ